MNSGVVTPTEDWTEADWLNFREWIIAVLQQNRVTVTFRKRDDSIRVLRCTLKSSDIVSSTTTDDKPVRKKSLSTIAVWDLEAGGWRSFSFKSVISLNIEL